MTLKRSGWIKRKTRIRPKKRSASEYARIYGSPERVEWMRTQRCLARRTSQSFRVCVGPVEGHHIKNGGTGRKADAKWCVPLCRKHHDFLHNVGPETFAAMYHLDLQDEARQTESRWQDYQRSAA